MSACSNPQCQLAATQTAEYLLHASLLQTYRECRKVQHLKGRRMANLLFIELQAPLSRSDPEELDRQPARLGGRPSIDAGQLRVLQPAASACCRCKLLAHAECSTSKHGGWQHAHPLRSVMNWCLAVGKFAEVLLFYFSFCGLRCNPKLRVFLLCACHDGIASSERKESIETGERT